MIEFIINYQDKWTKALLEHLELVFVSLVISVLIAMILTIISLYSKQFSKLIVYFFSVIYSIPSLALFSLLIPFTGLGKETALIGLIVYSQYILLRNFISGINSIDNSIIESAVGMGLSTLQTFYMIQLPLAKRSIVTGIRLTIISTVGITTIAASINAGGLGTILFDGLRTMNTNKIIWGSVLSAGLALGLNYILSKVEQRI